MANRLLLRQIGKTKPTPTLEQQPNNPTLAGGAVRRGSRHPANQVMIGTSHSVRALEVVCL